MDTNVGGDGNKYYNNILSLCSTYENNPYMLERIQYYINEYIPKILASENYRRQERIKRNIELVEEQDFFYKIFLHNHPYYYLPCANMFYQYTNDTYTIIKEDDVQYTILSLIGSDDILSQHKQKTKQLIIQKIKEHRHIFKSIPSSITIQKIINILQNNLFNNKIEVKYFLTVLGDRILKKNNDYLFFMDSTVKRIITMLDAYNPTGIVYNSSNFITKYHESHNVSKYRILFATSQPNLMNDLYTHIIDFMCVCVHYSKRYDNSEKYLHESQEIQLKNKILYLSNNSQDDIVNSFIEYSIDKVEQPITNKSLSITWDNIHYLWKQYLSIHHIPNTYYNNPLKNILQTKLVYNKDNDSFIGITSKYLPEIKCFLEFWNQHITIDPLSPFNEYEISELLWIVKNNCKIYTLTEQAIVNMIQYFFNGYGVCIQNNKYIQNIVCDIWDKKTAIRDIVLKYQLNATTNKLISIDELYDYYVLITPRKEICGKDYFNRYVKYEFSHQLELDSFINPNSK